MPEKYRPPQDEKDTRLMSRELLLKNMPEDEVAEATKLPPATVHKISEWLKTPYGTIWVKQRHPGMELKDGRWAKPEPRPEQAAVPQPVGEEVGGSEEGLSQGVDLRQGGELQWSDLPGSESTERRSQPSISSQAPESLPPGAIPQGARVIYVGPGGRQQTQSNLPANVSDDRGVTLETHVGSFDSGPATGKRNNAFLTPKTILFFDYAKAMGATKDLPLFLEECVEGYFKNKYGIIIAFVRGPAG